jgi:hypothetical protein
MWPVFGAAALAGIGIGIGIAMWTGGSSPDTPPDLGGPAATAVIERGTIFATETFPGTLGRGSPSTVTSRGEGTITRIAEQGHAVERGDELYRLDEQPVILLQGTIPMFRDLESADSGADMEQLKDNLVALGYGGLTVAEAVRRWQSSIGAEVTGTVSRSSVVFMPEGGRIENQYVDAGDVVSPGMPIMDITGTAQVVSLEADVGDRGRFETGSEVTIQLPGGDEVGGEVSRAAVVGVQGEGGVTESITEVEVTLDELVDDSLIGAAVDVIVPIEERADVLLVPVNALLALSEGGFGLELVNDDGTTSIVGVTTGLFADGRVQVEGDQISEGMVVGTAGR